MCHIRVFQYTRVMLGVITFIILQISWLKNSFSVSFWCSKVIRCNCLRQWFYAQSYPSSDRTIKTGRWSNGIITYLLTNAIRNFLILFKRLGMCEIHTNIWTYHWVSELLQNYDNRMPTGRHGSLMMPYYLLLSLQSEFAALMVKVQLLPATYGEMGPVIDIYFVVCGLNFLVYIYIYINIRRPCINRYKVV